MPAAIILAAGFSRRLGRPKQTLTLNGETLLAHAVRIAAEAGLSPILLVLNPALGLTPPPNCEVVLNPEAAEGMASSIRHGVAAAMDLHSTGAVLMTCDQVRNDAAHIRKVLRNSRNFTVISASFYAKKNGIPAFFPSTSFNDLLQLQGDTGARNLLRDAASISFESLNIDIDTTADLIHIDPEK